MRIGDYGVAKALVGEKVIVPFSDGSGNVEVEVGGDDNEVVVVLVESADPSLCFNGGQYRDFVRFGESGWKYGTSWDGGCCPKCGRYFNSGQVSCPCGGVRGEWQEYPLELDLEVVR